MISIADVRRRRATKILGSALLMWWLMTLGGTGAILAYSFAQGYGVNVRFLPSMVEYNALMAAGGTALVVVMAEVLRRGST